MKRPSSTAKGSGTETTHWRVGDPGDDPLDQVGGGLGHAPPGTRRTKPAPLAAEGQQQLVLAGVTAQPEKAMGEDTALQIVVQFAFHIGGQTSGVGISIE